MTETTTSEIILRFITSVSRKEVAAFIEKNAPRRRDKGVRCKSRGDMQMNPTNANEMQIRLVTSCGDFPTR